MFGYNNIYEARELLVLITLMVLPIPIVTVAVLKGLGWAETIFLKNKEERIAPYLITGLLYLTLYLQLARTNGANPLQVTSLAAVIVLFTAFFINNFFKISLHAAGAMAMVSIIILAVMFYTTDTFIIRYNDLYIGQFQTMHVLFGSIILAGLICTSRLYLNQHTTMEIYAGALLGFFAPLIAYYFIT